MVAAALLLALASSPGPADPVSFLVMGKTTNHRQSSSGDLALLNYHFFAEIFVKEEGRVSEASLRFPNGSVESFEDLGYVLELHGGRFDDESALDRLYPNGDYAFRFRTPSGNVDRVLSVRGTGGGASRIPRAPLISLLQDGEPVSPESVDAGRDLTVTWSGFQDARADANGILDDLLFVVVGNCRGEKIVHSGRPFEETPFLDHRTTSYVVPREKLRAGEPHQLFVEHATVDTSREEGIVGLVTYASTTFLDFRTLGSPAGEPCPVTMPRMDAGQTDREAAKGEPR